MGNSKTMHRAGLFKEPAQVLIQELRLSTRDRDFEEPQTQLAAIGAAGRPGPKDRVRRKRDNAVASGQRGHGHVNTPREVGGRRLARQHRRADRDDDNRRVLEVFIGDSPESRSSTSLVAPAMRRSAEALVQRNDLPVRLSNLASCQPRSKPHTGTPTDCGSNCSMATGGSTLPLTGDA